MSQINGLVHQNNLEEKRITFADVMVVSSSMFCRVKDDTLVPHTVVPYRGIVIILTNDNKEEEYCIYVGYCKQCKTYTVFDTDYRKLVRTRESMPKYKNAISKWKKDIEFVEKYKEDERESVKINSIVVK